jgi:hypothetical protein
MLPKCRNLATKCYKANSSKLKATAFMGRVIAQAVCRWLPIAEARVRTRVRSYWIYCRQIGTGTGFLRVLLFPLPVIPPTAPRPSSSITRGRYRMADVLSGLNIFETYSHSRDSSISVAGLLVGYVLVNTNTTHRVYRSLFQSVFSLSPLSTLIAPRGWRGGEGASRPALLVTAWHVRPPLAVINTLQAHPWLECKNSLTHRVCVSRCDVRKCTAAGMLTNNRLARALLDD